MGKGDSVLTKQIVVGRDVGDRDGTVNVFTTDVDGIFDGAGPSVHHLKEGGLYSVLTNYSATLGLLQHLRICRGWCVSHTSSHARSGPVV